MTMNNAGDEITFIDPPASVSQSLGLYMRSVFPRRIENDTVDNHFLRIRVKQSISCAYLIQTSFGRDFVAMR